ncbi:MAG: radical SAM protein [Solirubrobacteraceae bacterium]|nr:radical SAM protein [Solirubrobacteraceae bacterium]
MLRLTTTPITTQPAPTVRMQLTSHSNLALRDQREAGGLRLACELPRELALATIRDAAAMGYTELVFEGGEPLLHRGLADLLTRAERHNLRTTIITNGTLLPQARRLDLVARLVDRIAVELHGTGATHDAAVDRAGAFTQALDGLALLRDAGATVDVRFALTAANATELPDVLALSAAEGAGGVEVRSAYEGGLGDDAIATLLDDAAAHAEALGLTLTSDLVGRDELMLFRDHYVPTPAARQLASVVPTIAIDATGRVRPIARTLPPHLMIGNLHAARLPQLAPLWLRSDRPRRLAEACDRAWWSAVAPDAPRATRWADELALHVDAPSARRAIAA